MTDEDVINRGVVEFEAERPMIESLLYVAGQFQVDHKTLAKSWVAEQLRVPIDVIDKIRRDEESAYKEVRAFLGQSTSLMQQLLNLYDLLAELLGKTKNSLDVHQMAALLHCFQACRYHMIMGNLACLRAHPIDQSSYRRKAIEFCAFAIKMMRSPEHAQIWMNAISNRAYDKYEAAFEICATIAESAEIMGPRLKKAYSTLSQQVHASPFAVATQIRVEERVHSLDYFQHQTDEKKTFLAMSFLSGLDHDYLILKALGAIIQEKTETFDQSTWNKALSQFEAAQKKVKEDWAPTLDPTGDFRKGKRPPRKNKKLGRQK